MKLRRVISFLILSALVITIAGCNNEEKNESIDRSVSTVSSENNVETEKSTKDQSSNESIEENIVDNEDEDNKESTNENVSKDSSENDNETEKSTQDQQLNESDEEVSTDNHAKVDYENAETFESDLNAGVNLEGKIVTFKVVGCEPDSAFGYNLWAGEHLNFVSNSKSDYKIGDTVTVKVVSIRSVLGSWIISYTSPDDNIPTTSVTESNPENDSTDYNDITKFETDLNSGKSMEGKIVSFVVNDIKPQSAFGYNLITGEHLNFVSASNPNVKVGDTVRVKVTEVSTVLGSWIIKYDMM